MTERRDHNTPDAFEEIIEAMKAEDEATWRRLKAAGRRPARFAKTAVVAGVALMVAGLLRFEGWGGAFWGGVGYAAVVWGVWTLLEMHVAGAALWRERRLRAIIGKLRKLRP